MIMHIKDFLYKKKFTQLKNASYLGPILLFL